MIGITEFNGYFVAKNDANWLSFNSGSAADPGAAFYLAATAG